MKNNRLYYHLKPYIPWRWRIALRRVVAQRRLRTCKNVWPINEAAARPPESWPGWPDEKKFAFVLTHDVEGPRGLTKCRQLMQLEQELGFRSSFNFIPEGDYVVPQKLREELVHNGFEVGLHDLHHDGRLYWSRREFSDYARQINRYIKEWRVSGFRSGFMLHNLDWLHDLNVKYDASTFDTDPFEPQSDGSGTIFPFWVPAPHASDLAPDASHLAPHVPRLSTPANGYIELPYTLPQDSTLFLIFKHSSPEMWKQKLDWIAEHGGMALVNVHPDYMAFGDQTTATSEYPSSFYREFLEYARTRYAGQYWQPLPREMAEHCEKLRPAKPPVSHRRICMVSYSSYQTDNRVIRYAEALADRGDSVDILSLKSDPNQPDVQKIGNVCVHHVQGRYSKNEKNKTGYLFPLLKFWLRATIQLTRNHFQNRYDLIHIHNIPDFLVFTAWLPKLTGAKIILDIHDVVPEFYASKFHLKPASLGVKMLKLVERLSAAFANHVIISNHLWHKMYVARSVAARKCSVFINNVNKKLFYRRDPAKKNSGPVIMFPGGLHWHQGLDIAIRAMSTVVKKIPTAEFHIYGSGNMKDELVALTRELGLTESVHLFDPLPVQQIAEVMSRADLGVVPKRADSFGNEAYSTKIMEFMSLGVPMVISETKIDRYYFDDSVVRFFESGNSAALAEAMIEVLSDASLRRRMVANALEYATQNSWDVRKHDYLELVDSLIEKRPVSPYGVESEPHVSGHREASSERLVRDSEALSVK